MNKILQTLNLPNIKYDDMEENKRFSVFIIFVVTPLALLLTYYEVGGYLYMLFLFLYRSILPKIVRY